MTSISGPDFITLLVSDLEASYHFYKNTLGFRESSEKQPNAYAFSMTPCSMAIRHAPDRPTSERPGAGIIIWLKSPDATALHNELAARGVRIVEPLRKSPFGMTFSLEDPDGYVLSVHDGG